MGFAYSRPSSKRLTAAEAQYGGDGYRPDGEDEYHKLDDKQVTAFDGCRTVTCQTLLFKVR